MPDSAELFASIAHDLEKSGVSIIEDGLPESLFRSLREGFTSLDGGAFHDAGVGRGREQVRDIRRDAISWITPDFASGAEWLDWTEQLRRFLNQHLFLGLKSFESHFAHYRPGDFYKKHRDAFRGQSNRVLSLVTYLNPSWQEAWGGELNIYAQEGEALIHRVVPYPKTLVIFLSEDFPHEVLAATQDRISVAGWFRVSGG